MNGLLIRTYQSGDEEAAVELWVRCGLVFPQNNPKRDIARKRKVNPEANAFNESISPQLVIANHSHSVILSEAKDLIILFRVN